MCLIDIQVTFNLPHVQPSLGRSTVRFTTLYVQYRWRCSVFKCFSYTKIKTEWHAFSKIPMYCGIRFTQCQFDIHNANSCYSVGLLKTEKNNLCQTQVSKPRLARQSRLNQQESTTITETFSKIKTNILIAL